MGFNRTNTDGQLLHFRGVQEQSKNFNSNYEDGAWNGKVEEGGGRKEHQEADPSKDCSKDDEDEAVDEKLAAPTLPACEEIQELLL